MSSRNVLLTPEARRRAPALHRALQAVVAAVGDGERRTDRALAAGAAILSATGIVPEYFTAVSTSTLLTVSTFEGETLVPIAARFGEIRLIDNVIVSPPPAVA
jgi:pantoate--beta-alanine ligase